MTTVRKTDSSRKRRLQRRRVLLAGFFLFVIMGQLFWSTTREESGFVFGTLDGTVAVAVARLPASFNASLPTLIMQLRGELGNHLSSIAHGIGIQWYAREHFGMDLQPVLRHQVLEQPPQQHRDSPKWKPSSRALQLCFPKLRGWNFDRGAGWKEYYSRMEEQKAWLAPFTRDRLSLVNGRRWLFASSLRDRQPVTPRDLDQALQTLQEAWQQPDRPIRSNDTIIGEGPLGGGIVSIPFLYSESLENAYLIDRYIDRFRDLFEFDFGLCCGDQAAPRSDETVLHYRNFATELNKDDTTGLEDVSSSQTADILLGHLQPGEKVAITTRIHNERLEEHVQALVRNGLDVRVIEGQSGVQDFCFLLQAQKELIGNFQSTFAFWAAILGRAKRARLYTVDSPHLRERCVSMDILEQRFLYNWTNARLKDRLHLQLIRAKQ